MRETTCGLDCYDACHIQVEEGAFPKLKGDSEHVTGNGALCALLNKYMFEAERKNRRKEHENSVD